MRVYVTEKVSVADTLAQVVGARKRDKGCFLGDGVAVTWCAGHIVELAMPPAYEGWEKWTADALPMVPEPWRFVPREGAEDQLARVCELLTAADEVVCATDGDREGEGIFRRVYEWSGAGAPVLRLWSSSTEPAALASALADLRPDSEYDGLAAAASARAKADWLVGLNATRAYSLASKAPKALNIGRVKTPTLSMVVARDAEIEAFEPVGYFTVTADMGGWSAESERIDEGVVASAVCMGRAAPLKVVQADFGPSQRKAPLPYNLDALMKDASRLFGYTPKRTLDAAQALYEKRLQTYPRTSSRHIEPADAAGAKECVSTLIAAEGSPVSCPAFEPDMDRIVDASKVDGHPAILPTRTLMEAGWEGLPEEERNVSALVCIRLVASVAPDWLRREGKVSVEGVMPDGRRIRFEAKGATTESAGWKGVQDASLARIGAKLPDEKEGSLPPEVEVGAPVAASSYKLNERKTKAPAAFTDASLLTAMETCGKQVEDEEAARALAGKGLGTAATRAAIIEGLVKAGQIERAKGKLRSTDIGRSVVAAVSEELASPELTGEWEARLAAMARGEEGEEAFVADAAAYARKAVADAFSREDELRRMFGAAGRHVVCACPLCGREVVRTGKDGKGPVVRCSSVRTVRGEDGVWRDEGGCGFKAWASVAGVDLSDAQIADAAAGKPVLVRGIAPKDPKKKPYDRNATLDTSQRDRAGCCRWVLESFERKPASAKSPGKPFGGASVWG